MNIQARKTGITILSGIVIAAVLLATPGLVPERSPLSAAPAYAAKTSGWEKQNNGTWKYYVKSKAVTGWQQIGGTWYFFSSNGAMKSGWLKYGGKWYYLGKASDGVMKTGWQKVDGKWYFFGVASDGTMQTGWQEIDGTWYFFSSSGAMKSGWMKYGGKWYYFGAASDGAMKAGWQEIGGKWYFFGASSEGTMQTGWQEINSKWYFFAADGVLQSGWKKYGGAWYYLGSASDGAMKTGWQEIGGVWYYFIASGALSSEVTLDKQVASVREGLTTTLYASAPDTGSKGVKWSSSDTSIATVDSAGKVTGKIAGTVTITAQAPTGSKYAQSTVTVIPYVPASAITVSPDTLALCPYDTKKLSYILTTPEGAPVSANDRVSWSSSNTDIATVNSSGAVTGKKFGTVTITATTEGGRTGSCAVEVKPTIIDISKWQGDIDWSKTSKAIDLAILRVSYGNDTDIEFKYDSYSASCKAYGVPFGVYSYARYTTAAEAEAEATTFYRKAIAGGRTPAFFVVDCETKYITRKNTEAYIAKLRSLAEADNGPGYRLKVGVYVANHLYESMNLNLERDENNPATPDFVWIPRYSTANNGAIAGVTPPKYPCDMWQYTSGGTIPGISGRVDMNTLFRVDGTKLSTQSFFTLDWLKTPAVMSGQKSASQTPESAPTAEEPVSEQPAAAEEAQQASLAVAEESSSALFAATEKPLSAPLAAPAPIEGMPKG